MLEYIQFSWRGEILLHLTLQQTQSIVGILAILAYL
jgi:hypothetical protein